MELHPQSRPRRRSLEPRGGLEPQMLGLNWRLEGYLGRVQQLEGENQRLRREIQGLRRSQQGARWSQTSLDKELGKVRAEVEVAWKERDQVELEARCLAQELQDLEQQRRWVAEAQLEARARMEDSTRELAEEQRAHSGLCEKVDQLEQEIHLLIQSHQEDVEHLQCSQPTLSAPFPGLGLEVPSLLELGQEYSVRAAQAWEEADEQYQSQVSRLEEAVDQARAQLAHVGQERGESQQKLRALQRELAVAQEVMAGLERSISQQTDTHQQELQHLQGQLQELEWEKGELGGQMEDLLEDKTVLGLEVSSYRALLHHESLQRHTPAARAARNVYATDGASRPNGMRSKPRSPASFPRLWSSPRSSFNGARVTSSSAASTAISRWPPRSTMCGRPTPPSAGDPVHAGNPEKPVARVSSYPKIQQNGAEAPFRPQAVQEQVTYAEPLSPPNEQQAVGESLEEYPEAVVHDPTAERPEMESVIECKVESESNGFQQQQIPSEETVAYTTAAEDRSAPFLDESGKGCDAPAEQRETYLLHSQPVQTSGDSTDSETEAVLEPTMGSNTSDLSEESTFDQVIFSQEENQPDGSLLHKVQGQIEEKLYADGEEMDTWDSVIERKVELKKGQSLEMDTGHAEPEDGSAREPGQRDVTEVNAVTFTEEHVLSRVTVPTTGTQIPDNKQEQTAALQPGQENVKNEEADEEDDDSQNVSVSWRTELEGDSYAQDNTLADTTPLIQYKSDDGNARASHCDDPESSDGEDKMEAGGTGSGTWSDSRSNRFGTMEDLCEETEEEAEEVGFDMSFSHGDDRDVNTKEHGPLGTDCDEEEEQVTMFIRPDQQPSDEDITQLVIPKVNSDVNVDYSDDLEDVDRLVELELEGLSTSTYSAHFAQHQASKSELATFIQEPTPQGTEDTIGEEMFIRVEPSLKAHQTQPTNPTIIQQLPRNEEQYIQDEDDEGRHSSEIMEQNPDCIVPMLTHANADDTSGDIDFHAGFDGHECHMEPSYSSGDESPNVSPYQPISTELAPSDLQDALLEATVYQELHKAETVVESEAPPKPTMDVNMDP